MLKAASLFSGIGGFDLAAEEAGYELVYQCEIDKWCNKWLNYRWPEVKKYGDIRELREPEYADVIMGGFPCQPFSTAGKQRGKEDDRYLWPEMLRVIKTGKPRWIIGENVPGIVNLALDNVLSDLETEGYTCWPLVIPACSLNARHKRDRLWILAYAEHYGFSAAEIPGGVNETVRKESSGQDNTINTEGTGGIFGNVGNTERTGRERRDRMEESAVPAYSNGERLQTGGCRKQGGRQEFGGYRENVPHTNNGVWIVRRDGEFSTTPEAKGRWSDNRRRTAQYEPRKRGEIKSGMGWLVDGIPEWMARIWDSEPDIPRVVNQATDRVNKLKGFGNAVVPIIPYLILSAIRYIEEGC